MQSALEQDLNKEVVMLWHKDTDLSKFDTGDCIVLPGGFSFGDYLRCGAIARFSPMMQSVIKFAESGGKVLGVCNGFQILCESGLLPGVLLPNSHQKFACKNVFLRSYDNQVLKIPIAHGDGRYFADDNTLEDLERNKQILFHYCNAKGETLHDANPNGAIKNIAGICNVSRNVFGMMPHPERATSTLLGNTDGKMVFNLLGLN